MEKILAFSITPVKDLAKGCKHTLPIVKKSHFMRRGHIFFCRDKLGGEDIDVINADGSEQINLADNPDDGAELDRSTLNLK